MSERERKLLEHMEACKEMHLWRCVCARIRDIADERTKRGIPKFETLKELNYDYYRTAIKRKFNEI